MNDFISYLASKCRMPAKKIPFFLYWVAQYNAFANNTARPEDRQAEAFLEVLSRKREDWQVKQVEKAISLYEYYSKSSPRSRRDRIGHAATDMPSNCKVAEEELIWRLRLRHRSLSTEKLVVVG